jgi:TfoX/Sxy family transcriptional regulator of competence genes
MPWKKAPIELVDFLADKMSDVQCEHRKMFGYPCYFLNGNMFIGIFEEAIFIRLSSTDTTQLRAKEAGVVPFEPIAGRKMKDYVTLPKVVFENQELFSSLIAKSVDHVSSLPEKKKKK